MLKPYSGRLTRLVSGACREVVAGRPKAPAQSQCIPDGAVKITTVFGHTLQSLAVVFCAYCGLHRACPYGNLQQLLEACVLQVHGHAPASPLAEKFAVHVTVMPHSLERLHLAARRLMRGFFALAKAIEQPTSEATGLGTDYHTGSCSRQNTRLIEHAPAPTEQIRTPWPLPTYSAGR